MTEHKGPNSSIYQGSSHFQFSSEKNWGVEQDDCKIFDSIDITHLADSISSVPFNLQHDIPTELFTVEQLEEFEVEASLAFSRHTFQCNSKSKTKTVLQTSEDSNLTPETDKLLKLILKDQSRDQSKISPDREHLLHHESQSCKQLDEILGNMKPLINILEEDKNVNINEIGTSEIGSKINENQMASISNDSKIEIINQDSGHWLDSMLNSDDE